MKKQKVILDSIASDLIKEKKSRYEGLDKETIDGELESEKDILSNIVRNNLTCPNRSNALTDEELMGQVQTCECIC
jgi:hypothetical protein